MVLYDISYEMGKKYVRNILVPFMFKGTVKNYYVRKLFKLFQYTFLFFGGLFYVDVESTVLKIFKQDKTFFEISLIYFFVSTTVKF